MSERERLTPEGRKSAILAAALKLAVRVGYQNVRRDAVAKEAGCANGLVNKYYGTLGQLRRDLMRQAVKNGNLVVVAQGLAANDATAKKAPENIKQQARASL